MKLSDKQQRFSNAISLLIAYADYLHIGLTFGDCYRGPNVNYGHPKSTHKSRLAVDFNIFYGGEYKTGVEANRLHNKLHDFWDLLGGANRIIDDLNHYSFEHDGVI